MGTFIKKFLIGIAIIAGCIGLTMNANAFETISVKPLVVLIESFNTYELGLFMKATYHLKMGYTLKIYSIGPGGDAYSCLGMINHIEALQKRGVWVITEISGIACSANALIWVAGDERVIHRHDLVMFHLAYIANSGGRVSPNDLPPLQKMILRHLNNWMRFKLTRTINDTEITNNMLDEPENWYKGIELFRIGVATKLIEN